MDHLHFKPTNLSQGISAVTGACNNVSAQERYDKETPLFVKKILEIIKPDDIIGSNPLILDYGCGIGRLSKEILTQSPDARVICSDDSSDMIRLAQENLGPELSKRAKFVLPWELNDKVDLVVLVYVLQHMPAIEIRDALSRIYSLLQPKGLLFYCSADYRMAVRFDNSSFYDDRFLGVNLQEELSRFFKFKRLIFNDEELASNETVKKLVLGKHSKVADMLNPQLLKEKQDPVWDWDETHPAIIYEKREIKTHLYNVRPYIDKNLDEMPKNENPSKTDISVKVENKPKPPPNGIEVLNDRKKITDKLVLVNKLSPGDILVMTCALRSLHKAYPGRFKTDVRSPCPEIFENSPYITKILVDKPLEDYAVSELKKDENHAPIRVGDVTFLISHYPDIHNSGWTGLHFSDGHRRFLAKQLGISIPRTGLKPDIFLSQTEKDWVSPFVAEFGENKPYWVINAGSKGDYTLKQYPYYQEVVDILKDKITFVQIGVKAHNHKSLQGVYDLVGKTNMRQLFRLIYHAEGVITCVSLPMHVANSLTRPVVVVAGARESVRWERVQLANYLSTNGCCPTTFKKEGDGCWFSKISDCPHLVDGVPLCMKLIRPEDVARQVELFYYGGVLKNDKIKSLIKEKNDGRKNQTGISTRILHG